MTRRYLIEAHLASTHISPRYTSTFVPDMVSSWLRQGVAWERMTDQDGWLLLSFGTDDEHLAQRLARSHLAHGWPCHVTDRRPARAVSETP